MNRARIAALLVCFVLAFLLAASQAGAASKQRIHLSVGEKGSRVTVVFAPRKEPIDYSIRLNGHHLEDRFLGTPSSGRKIVVGADDGLRFGKNVVRVRAIYADGKIKKPKEKFEIRSGRPLAGARSDARGIEGAPVKLRAALAPRGTKKGDLADARRKQGRTRLSWRLVDKPRGSKAKLKRDHSAKPKFAADMAGTYRFALTATRPNGSSRTDISTTQVQSSEITDAGVFIGTVPFLTDPDDPSPPTGLQIVGSGDDGTIPFGPSAPGGPITALIYNRCTLAVLAKPFNIPTGSAGSQQLFEKIAIAEKQLSDDSGCEPLVVVAGTGYGEMGELGSDLNQYLGQDGTAFYPSATETFWAIFVPPALNSKKGTVGAGWSNFPYFDDNTATGRMAGQLVQDQNGRYVFRPSTEPAFGADQLTFHTDRGGISLNPPADGFPANYPAGTPGCPGNGHGGFQVLVLGAIGEDALVKLDISANVGGDTYENGDTFWVNGCNQQDSEDAAAAMSKIIGTNAVANNDFPAIVFVQGVGDALPSSMSTTETEILRGVAGQIGRYGGSPGLFINNKAAVNGPGYSFVGQTWPLTGGRRVATEVTSDIAGASPPPQLDGYFTFDRRSRIAPSIGTTAAAQLGSGLQGAQALRSASAILHSDSGFQREPFPGEGEADWETAMHYLAMNLTPTIRFDPDDACFAPKTDSNGFVYDIRATYCGGGQVKNCDGPYDSYYSQIAPGEPLATVPSDLGIDQGTWTGILQQLQKEFLILQELNCTTQSLQQVFGSVSQKADLNVNGMVDDVNGYIESLQKKKGDGIVGDIFEVIASVSNVVAVASASETEDGGTTNFFWGVQGMIDLGLSIASIPTTSGPVLGPLPPSTTATGFATALDNGLNATSSAMTTPRNQIASDWGRLQAFDATATGVQSSDVTAAETTLSYGVYDRAWKSILPSVFSVSHIHQNLGVGQNADPVDVNNWQCVIPPSLNLPGTDEPFDAFTPNSYAGWPVVPAAENFAGLETYALAAPNFPGKFYEPIQVPDAKVLTPLFLPLADPTAANPTPITNGVPTSLGMNKDAFYADVITAAQANNKVFEVSKDNPDCPYP